MDAFVVLPTPKDVNDELKQIVQHLDSWPELPLRALRALPSVRFWEPAPEARSRYEDLTARKFSNAAISQRIRDAILRVAIEKDQKALGSIFGLLDPKDTLTGRRKDAAKHRGIEPEGFRTSAEPKLILKLSEEMIRGELEWAEHEVALLRALTAEREEAS